MLKITGYRKSQLLKYNAKIIRYIGKIVSKKIFKYTLGGAYVSDFDLTAANDHATGITTDGTSIWVVDHSGTKAYKYTVSGSLDSEFPLDGGNSNARGITTNGTNIWVVDAVDDKAYRYDMTGTFVSDFSLSAANGAPQGLTVTPR